MKALVYTEIKKVELHDIPEPKPGFGEVLVRVSATGICGSDVHGFLGKSARRQPGLVLGHETMGVVAGVGEGVDKSLLDQRVSVNPLISCGRCEACSAGRQNVCRSWRLIGLDRLQGAFAEFFVIPARNVTPLPAHVPDSHAVMVEPLANAVHLIGHAPLQSGFGTAVIFGGGTLGVCTLSVARTRGIRVIAVIEPNALRGKASLDLGAENVLNPREKDIVGEVNRLTDGRGVDLGVDAVGLALTRQQSAAICVRGGAALLLGLEDGPTSFDFMDLIRREIRLQCSYGFTERDFAAAFDLIARGQVNYSRWTDVLPLSEAQGAFERLCSNPGDRIKIALKP